MIGQRIDHYLVTERLGRGGMGEVWLARDDRLGRTVALKLLASEHGADPQYRARFEREARAAAAIGHPNIVHIYDVGEVDGQSYIAMEEVVGEPLDARLAGGPLPAEQVLSLGAQVADALQAAHEAGILHRDIKAANVMVTEHGDAKVLDFGIAKLVDASGGAGTQAPTGLDTATGALLGTVAYMSPEQTLGKPLDGRSDLFSLGALLYQMITGRLPFGSATAGDTIDQILHGQPRAIAQLNYEAPEDLERIIRRCLEKDPELRYQTAADLRADLLNLQRALGATDGAQQAGWPTSSACRRW